MEFFETKVIKVKKKKRIEKCPHFMIHWIPELKDYRCCKCGKLKVKRTEEPKKSNIVNGENLDKIKFPCFCSYSINTLDNPAEKQLGFIDYISIYGEKAKYILLNIGWQTKGCKLIPIFDSLENLIISYHIHILKGKILIFKEEK